MIKNINITDAEVSAELHGYMYLALYDFNGILHAGSRMTADIVSNNEIRINDGIMCNYGRFMRIVGSETVRIENGTNGVKRTDLIVARFTTTGTKETHTLTVIKGPAGGAEPSHNQTDIYSGTGTRDLVLYAVHLDGLNITSVERKCQEYMSMSELINKVNTQESGMSELINKVNTQESGTKFYGHDVIETKNGITLEAKWNDTIVEFYWHGNLSNDWHMTATVNGEKFGNDSTMKNVLKTHTAFMFDISVSPDYPIWFKYARAENGFWVFTMKTCTVPKGTWLSGSHMMLR
jgi:hypothetical protein